VRLARKEQREQGWALENRHPLPDLRLLDFVLKPDLPSYFLSR
jgi:hypothetical protein